MTNPFVPDTYKMAASGGGGGRYINPAKVGGEKPFRFRCLSENPLRGWQYWTTESKPKRLPWIEGIPGNGKPSLTPADLRREKDGTPEIIKPFWAFTIWDYQAHEVKIFLCTQRTIQDALAELSANENWGHPRFYDVTLTRKGQEKQTEYVVHPGLRDETPPAALAELAASPINLDALLTGEDPFTTPAAPAIASEADGSAKPVVFRTLERTAAIDALKASAKTAGFDTPAKIRQKIAELDGEFISFESLTVEEIADYTAIFNGLALTPPAAPIGNQEIEYEDIPF